MSDKIIIYHRACADGFCSAWLFHKVFGDNAEYYAAQYGELPPDVTNKNVYIVDFSYKRPIMEKIIRDAKSVVVLDHHKTAQEELKGLGPESYNGPQVVFDMNKSGAHLAWNWLWQCYMPEMSREFPLEGPDRMHWLVAYVEDHDLWAHKLPNTFEVKAALKLATFEFSKWDEYAKCSVKDLIPAGKNILQYQRILIDQAKRNARETIICGHKILCVNSTVLFSDIAGELSEGRAFGACYFDRDDGMRQFSLRSRDNGIDVSEVAKKFGGGGHRNASGFEIKVEDMNKLNEGFE